MKSPHHINFRKAGLAATESLRHWLLTLRTDDRSPPPAFFHRVCVARVPRSDRTPTRRLRTMTVTRKAAGNKARAKAGSRLEMDILGSLGTGVMAVDNTGRCTFANPALCKLLGWSEKELVGSMPPFVDQPGGSDAALPGILSGRLEDDSGHADLDAALLAKDRSRIPVTLHVAPVVAEGHVSGFVASVTPRAERPDGSRSWVWDQSFPLKVEGRSLTVGLATDITERKAEKELLRTVNSMLEQAQEIAHLGSWKTDFAQGTTVWSPQMYRILGYTPPDGANDAANSESHYTTMPEAEHRSRMRERLHPEERSQRPAGIPLDEGSHVMNARMLLPGDVVRHIEASYRIVSDGHGKPAHSIGIVQDVTDRVERANMLTQLQKLDAIGQLSGGIAHDLNNILAIVIGNLTESRHEEPGQPRIETPDTESVQRALDAARRGASLLNSLLSLSRREPATLKIVEINQHLRDLLPILRFILGPRIDLQDLIAIGLQPIRMDQSTFDSALLNIVINARDAIGDRSSRVILRTLRGRTYPEKEAALYGLPEGTYAEILVEDDGPGMTAEVLEKAMEPYFTTKGSGEGTGLGLPMVWAFARQLKGTVAIASKPGDGTQIRILLPSRKEEVNPAQSTPTPAQAMAMAANMVAAQGAKVLRILLVDDEPELRRLAERILVRRGHHVTPVADAGAARAALSSGKFDVMVTDIVMPGAEDGMDLSESAAADWPHMKIVQTSGYSRKLMRRTGSWALLQKPYLPEDLIEAVEPPPPAGAGQTAS